MEHTLTLEDVCALLKISVQTGRNRLCNAAPMPPSFRTGRRRLFLASAVDDWILQQAGAGCAKTDLKTPRFGASRDEGQRRA